MRVYIWNWAVSRLDLSWDCVEHAYRRDLRFEIWQYNGTSMNPMHVCCLNAGGGSKVAKLETGATISVPLFINTGEVIKIDTRTDQYLSRADK